MYGPHCGMGRGSYGWSARTIIARAEGHVSRIRPSHSAVLLAERTGRATECTPGFCGMCGLIQLFSCSAIIVEKAPRVAYRPKDKRARGTLVPGPLASKWSLHRHGASFGKKKTLRTRRGSGDGFRKWSRGRWHPLRLVVVVVRGTTVAGGWRRVEPHRR
ncbi:hypothetical protein BD413DRAFT_69290 [Trametes elegans]|nr:hypothetical protein BD413DRAFT_69290 [Trametes elegans]